MEDFGIKNVVIKNIERAIQKQSYREIKSQEDLDSLIEQLKSQLDESKKLLSVMLSKTIDCKHEYGNPSYTIQNRIIGYATVYEHVCKKCGSIESHSQYSEDRPQLIPDWCRAAKQRYYNNFI